MTRSQVSQARRVLLVEDNPGVAAAIVSVAGANCFEVEWKQDLESAKSRAFDSQLELILIDRGLPDGDGVHLMKSIRGAGVSTPVIVISARSGIEDILGALDAGADDYVAKPFDYSELISRCNAVLRRGNSLADLPQQVGNLKFWPEAQHLEINGRTLILPKRQLQLISALMLHKEQPCLSGDLQSACGIAGNAAPRNSLEAIVCRLRIALKKAGADVSIESIRGTGYRLAAPSAQAAA